MASVVSTQPAMRRLPGIAQRLTPAEGWITVLLHALGLLMAGWAVQRADWADGLTTLTTLAPIGVLVGFILAKSGVPDLLSHTLAVVFGGLLVLWVTTGALDDLGATRRDRLDELWKRGEVWWERTWAGKQVDDLYLFILVMGFTLWLVAYTSAWMLYRRRWPMAAVLVPGIVILINLGYAPQAGTVPLVLYVLIACTLAARHFIFRRQMEWSRYQIPTPDRLPWHFLSAGVNVALVVILLGWTLPLTPRSNLVDEASERLKEPLQRAERQWERWFSSINGSGPSRGGSYAAFGESFELGGPLQLSDDPALVLRAEQPAYLAGHRYDAYDGHGWSSDVERTFNETAIDGERYSPQVTFEPNQPVLLSLDVRGQRTPVTGKVTVLSPKGDLIFTIDTYLTSSEPTSVQLSWRQLADTPFSLDDADLGAIPPDLWRIVDLLRRAEFVIGADGEPRVTDPGLAQQISEQQRTLERRFLSTHWEVGTDLRVETLYVTGQIPIYDDVEAVFDSRPSSGDATYDVNGLTSRATPEELQAAATVYPDYVTARYLQQSETVTQRTVDLAREVTAGADNPFDAAVAIEQYLRSNYTYDENVDFPPSDQDVVDFFLFDSKEGYCEYYASAMIVMLRSLDIPARLVAGYHPVAYDEVAQGFVYREKNAHAWVEVFFPDYGWIPFEPTASRPALDYGADEAPVAPTPTPEPRVEPTPTPEATPAVAQQPPVADPPPADTSRTLLDRTTDQLGWASRLTGLALLLGVAVCVVVWLWGFRGLSPGGAIYARLLRVGRWWGVRTHPAMTPVEYADELGRIVPAARAPARAVAELYVVEQYGAHAPSVTAQQSGWTAWRQLRRALLRFGPRRRRRGDRGGGRRG